MTLAAGPAVAAGSVAGSLLTPGIGVSQRLAAITAVTSAGALGVVDDLHGSGDVKGLRGHLGALATGEVTSGSLKLAGLAAAGVISGTMARGGRGGVIDALLAGAVVAGAANFANLLDLRPGRAGKAFLLASAPALFASGTPGTWSRRRADRLPRCCQRTSARSPCWATPERTHWELPGASRWSPHSDEGGCLPLRS